MKYILLCLSFNLFSLDVNKFVKFVKDKQVKNVSELLSTLPETYREKYLYLYNSQGTQETSLLEPRVVLFNESSTFLMTFNSSDDLIGGSKVDLILFDKNKSAYDSLALEFKRNKKPEIEINSTSCFQCHQSFKGKIVPISKSYLGGIYPGVYGSLGDSFTKIERRYLKRFQRTLSKHKRYKRLKKFKGSKQWEHPKRPSTMLGHLVNRKIYEMLSKYFKETLVYNQHKYALLASVTCGEEFKISDFFKDSNFLTYAFFKKQYEKSKYLQDKKFFSSISQRQRLMGKIPRTFIEKFSPKYEKSATWFKSIVMKLEPDNKELINILNSFIENGTDQTGDFYNFSEYLYLWILKDDLLILEDFNWAKSKKQKTYQKFPALENLHRTCERLKEKANSR